MAVKLHYYADTDSLCVEITSSAATETREVASGLNVDLDANGDVVGFDLDHASERLVLSTLETKRLPVQVYRFGRRRVDRALGERRASDFRR